MIVNNFKAIANLIHDNFFEYMTYTGDSSYVVKYFWHIQLMIRYKDNPEMVSTLNKNKGNTNRSFMDLYIHSDNELLKNEEFIKRICESVGARAYINLCPKSYQTSAKNAMMNMADAICTENWRRAKTAFKSAVAKSNDKRLFMVDYDEKDELELNLIKEAIEATKNSKDTRKNLVIETLPTKNGYHIICQPFDIGALSQPFQNLDIKKDALTLLYF